MKLRMILLSMIVAGTSWADNVKQLSKDDLAVVAHLHAVDQMEIDAGNLAQANGAAPGKAYGKQLVTDHTAFDKKLVAYASKHGVTQIPDDTTQTQADKKAMMDTMAKLKGMTGVQFDGELGSHMAADHEKELMRANTEIAAPHDKELIGLLQNVKPTLQKHADAARKLATK